MSIFFKRIEGIDLKLSGKTYVMPPMNFCSIIAVTPHFEQLKGLGAGGMPTKKQLHAIAKIIHKALRRNYPFIRFSTVINGLDMHNMGDALTKAMHGNKEQPKGEAAAGNQ